MASELLDAPQDSRITPCGHPKWPHRRRQSIEFWELVGVEWALNSSQSWLLMVNHGHTESLAIIGLLPDFLRSPNGFFMEPFSSVVPGHVAPEVRSCEKLPEIALIESSRIVKARLQPVAAG